MDLRVAPQLRDLGGSGLVDLLIHALLGDLQVLDPLEEGQARLHGLVGELVLLVLHDRDGDAVEEGLAVQQVLVPDTEAEFETLEALHLEEQRRQPAHEVELVLQIDGLELAVQFGQVLLEELVEEVHPPLDGAGVIIDQMPEHVALPRAECQVREGDEDLASRGSDGYRVFVLELPEMNQHQRSEDLVQSGDAAGILGKLVAIGLVRSLQRVERRLDAVQGGSVYQECAVDVVHDPLEKLDRDLGQVADDGGSLPPLGKFGHLALDLGELARDMLDEEVRQMDRGHLEAR